MQPLNSAPKVEETPVEANPVAQEGLPSNLGISPQAAWANVFSEPFDVDKALPFFDVLVGSLSESILEDQLRPLDKAAKYSTGDRMSFVAKIFEKAVSDQRMENFPEGSIGKMALVGGNVEGAYDAAKSTPEIHQGMRDANQVTLFVQAMIEGEVDLMSRLTSRVDDTPLIDPYYTNKQGFNSLISYLKKAPDPRIEVIRAFSQCLLDSRNLMDESAMYYQRFLSALDPYGKTALHALALRMRNNRLGDQQFIDIFSWFSEKIDINTPDTNDETVLHAASQFNRPAVNRALLDMGGRLEWVSHKGRTPLNIAAHNGYVELVKTYLDHDLRAANIDPSIKQGASDGPRPRLPLIAARNNHWGVLAEYLQHSVEGVNQHEQTSDRHTPLILAVKAIDHRSVCALLKAGAEVNATNGHGYTAVHYAAHQFNGVLGDVSEHILFDLLAQGGSLAIADNNGQTALDIISQRSDIDTSEELFYTINTSLLTEWVFSGNRAKTELFLDQAEMMTHTTMGVLRKTHPLVHKAQKWLSVHQESSNEEIKAKIKQAKSDLCGILVDTLSYSAALLSLADVDVNTTIKGLYESVPEHYRLPALAATGFVVALARATEFRGDMTRFSNIGYAADAMAGNITKNVLKPVFKAISGCTKGEQGPLKHVYRYFRSMRDSCKKISSACKAFVAVIKRKDLKNASPHEIAASLDQELLNAVGKMTHQDFQKFRGQARLNARQGQVDNDSVGLG